MEVIYCPRLKKIAGSGCIHFSLLPYLWGYHFQVRTDHAPLKWLYCIKEPEGQVAWWLQKLQEFDFEVSHRRLRHVNQMLYPDAHAPSVASVRKGRWQWYMSFLLRNCNCQGYILMMSQSEDQEWKCLIEAKKSNPRPTARTEQDGKSMEIRRLWQL